jgi:DNA-binding PadR family transcriptional regulator
MTRHRDHQNHDDDRGFDPRRGGPRQRPADPRMFGARGRGGPGFGPRGRGRARRGDIRAALLTLLAERPMNGYEMIGELESRTHGVWRPSPGSIYPTLQALEDEGLVRSSDSGGKRAFELTEAGQEAQQASAQQGRAPWEAMNAETSDADLTLRDVLGHVMMATRQVADAGTEAHKAKAAEVLVETRRQLYAILAEA